MPVSSSHINRRQFIQGTIASTALVGGISAASARQSSRSPQYTLEQNGKCIPIAPLSMSGLPVKQFYDYRTPKTNPSSHKYASFGSEELQRKNTSILFLYEGPNGLSLVAVHDKIDAGDGGAVTFRVTNLPAKGKLVVKDDSYNSSTNLDTWDYSKNRNWKGKESASANISWAWDSGSSDGFVYRGLGNQFEFTIYPQFNENAILSDENNGKLKQWEFLSGNMNDPSRTKLDMTKPVTISSKPCQQETTPQQTARNTKQKDSGKHTTSSKPSTNQNINKDQSIFDQIWNGFVSALESLVSFFTSLF
jgi:hypothetical protein